MQAITTKGNDSMYSVIHFYIRKWPNLKNEIIKPSSNSGQGCVHLALMHLFYGLNSSLNPWLTTSLGVGKLLKQRK